MLDDKVVVTGLGTITPLGLNVRDTWQNAIAGFSGVGPITRFDSSELPVHIACEAKNFHAEDYIPGKEVRRRDRYQCFAAAAVKEALSHAGINPDELNPHRVGVTLSTAIGGLESLEVNMDLFRTVGMRKVTPLIIPMLMSNGAAGLVSIDYGFMGPAFCIASACASGADGIGMGWMLINSNLIDVAITGGSEATITSIGVVAFDRAGALSRKNNDRTPQPFDMNRDGLVMGEGAGVVILERESHARKRGANILAVLSSHAATADAYHITAPPEDGAGGARAIRNALTAANISIDQVDYINAHGTGTALNDAAETNAIKSVFGSYAYSIPVSSTKSMTGHMMGASGAVEAIIAIQAIREGIIPPTINYETPDPQCDLDYVPNVAREKKVNVAVSNSFGFGGHNAVLVMQAYKG